MEKEMAAAAPPPPHVLIVSFPAPGHINPTLTLATALLHRGVEVTFGTTKQGLTHIKSSNCPAGITLISISDGFDELPDVNNSQPNYPRQLEAHGEPSLADIVRSFTAAGRHVECIVYNFLLPWAANVAASYGIRSALYWVQPVSVLSLYYHKIYAAPELFDDISKEINVPALPPLATEDLPSFLLPTNTHPHALPMNKDMFDMQLNKKSQWALVNSFEALEADARESLASLGISTTTIGPLIPSAKPKVNEEGKEVKDEAMEWLDGKSPASVVYISFGSIAEVTTEQVDEIAHGLMALDHQEFVWVIRPPEGYPGFPAGFDEVVKERGKVVRWCAQVSVLAHPSIGGFVTHSGWNSTLEGLTHGKPMVCVPQWSDQATNSKLVTHKWKVGIRGRKNAEGLIEREELRKCIEELMGEEKGRELRENAAKWGELAKKAIEEGGSSEKNIREFVDSLKSKAAPLMEHNLVNGNQLLIKHVEGDHVNGVPLHA